jgi:hypothetical protein
MNRRLAISYDEPLDVQPPLRRGFLSSYLDTQDGSDHLLRIKKLANYIYVCMYVCMYIYICVCVCMYVCMYSIYSIYSMYVCMYVYIYIYIYIYIHADLDLVTLPSQR